MKKKYDLNPLNDFFNFQATPEEVKSRLSEIAIHYAKTTDEYALEEMRHDLSFLQLLIECIGTIKHKDHE